MIPDFHLPLFPQHFYVLILAAVLLPSCNDKKKYSDHSPKPQISQKATKILPYTFPQSIDDIYTTNYIVDSLFRSSISNPGGDLKRKYEINFTEIIGLDNEKKWKKNTIKALKPANFFDPEFESDSILYLPFHVDEEREWTIITVWKKTTTDIQFQYHFKNLFITKYGRIRMIDKLVYEDTEYFLLEKYEPDDDGMYHSLEIVYSQSDSAQDLRSLYKHQLEKIDLEKKNPHSFLSIIDKKITLSSENTNPNDPAEIIIELEPKI